MFFFCCPLPVQFLGIRQFTIAGVHSLMMSFLILMLVFFTFLGLLQMMCSDVPMLSIKIRYCIQVRKSNLRRLTIFFFAISVFLFSCSRLCILYQPLSPSLIFNRGNLHPSLQQFPFPSCLHFISSFLVLTVFRPFSSLTISLATIYSVFYFPFMLSMFVTILCITILPLKYFNHLCCS